MWVYDAETLRFLAVNDAAIRHYGWSCEEFLQMAITDIRPLEDVDALLENLDSGEVGSPLPAVWRHRRQDGTTIDVEISAGKIVFEGRDAALVLARDVTERRRLEERLVEAEKMEAVGRLAGGVAHDFNNLLTVISGYAAILREDLGEREALTEITHAAEQAAALTGQLLAFSRRQVLRPHAVDLNAIVAGMQSMIERIIGDDVRVTVRLAPGPAAVVADRAQVERVVLNLAANARDAMPQGGRLTIETALVDLDDGYVAAHGEVRPGPHVLLAISDTGTGMSEEVRRHLFEPFFTTKAGGGGTGRPGDGLRRGQAERRLDLRLQRGGPRHHVQDLPPGRRRATGRGGAARRRAGRRGGKRDDRRRRGRRVGARAGAPDARGPRLRGADRARRRDGGAAVHRAPWRRRSAAH